MSAPPKPPILPVRPEGIPNEPKTQRRWVVWKLEWLEGKNGKSGKWTKPPYIATATETGASSINPATWRSFDEALAAYEDGKCDGIGFVLGDGWVGFDQDHTGHLRYVEMLQSYTERSPLGAGLHTLVKGVKPAGKCKVKLPNGEVYELYDHGRYFTVTGHVLPQFPPSVEDRVAEIAVLHGSLFPSRHTTPSGNSLTDAETLTKAKNSKNGEEFTKRWNGDLTLDNNDDSAADFNLCRTLAFWTNRDAVKMDRLFRQSKLMRDKWNTTRGPTTYGALTIAKAIEVTPNGYQGAIERTIHLTYASEIAPRPVFWLWLNRLPLGALGLVAGREGIGKTTVAYTLAADITRGRLPGETFGTPRTVLVVATEDSWEHTIVPRLMAAGADLTRVARVEVVTAELGKSFISLPKDIPALIEKVEETDAALILLDPLISRLDSKLDTHKDAEVRQALEPLAHLADITSAVVLGIIHVNKSGSRDPLNLVMGSRAFTSVPRAILFVSEDPEDEDGHGRVIGQAKNNLGRMDLPSLTFEIRDVIVATTEEGDIHTGKVEWIGEDDRSIQDIVDMMKGPDKQTAIAKATAWLKEFLELNCGGAESSVIKKAGDELSHSKSSLRRACKNLNITIESKDFPRTTWWLMPGVTLDMLTAAKRDAEVRGVHRLSGM